jgi:membrane protease subunit HflK
MQQTKAPEEVKAAFDDAIKAQQDEERLVNEAEAYSRKIIPIAEGRAKRTFEEARAYKERVILEAVGKTAKFSEILPQYQKAPQVMRERLYLDTMQDVYAKTPKVLIDVSGGNNLVYLPLDKLIAARDVVSNPLKDEEDDNSMAANDKSSQSMNSLSRNISRRPSYEDAERPSRNGA